MPTCTERTFPGLLKDMHCICIVPGVATVQTDISLESNMDVPKCIDDALFHIKAEDVTLLLFKLGQETSSFLNMVPLN